MFLGKNIAYYRKTNGYTQEQLAEQLGVTAQSVSKWENETTNPDVSLLPNLSKALGVDINELFEEETVESNGITLTELPDVCYDAVLSLYLKAQRSFYGVKTKLSQSEYQKRLAKCKEDFKSLFRCAYMICEGNTDYGSVFTSDAFTFIDRDYGCLESSLLFDVDKAGEILTVIGNKNVRKVLKIIYQKLITAGEVATYLTPDAIASECGLDVDDVNEAATQLVHAKLLDENETIENGIYKKEYAVLHTKDFIFVISILRIAYILASDMTYISLMYKSAIGMKTYSGDACK